MYHFTFICSYFDGIIIIIAHVCSKDTAKEGQLLYVYIYKYVYDVMWCVLRYLCINEGEQWPNAYTATQPMPDPLWRPSGLVCC